MTRPAARHPAGRAPLASSGAALAVVLCLLAGCADPRGGSLGPAPTAASPASTAPTGPTPPPTPADTGSPPATPATRTASPSTGATPRPQNLTMELWYVRDGRITPTRRTRPATLATSRLALTELAAGPTTAEAATGMSTLLPAGVEVTRIADGVATLPPLPAGAAATRRLREAQVVYTLTQFPSVRRVRFGTGDPVDRATYADLLPAIVVTGPVVGQRVTSPVTVTGTADVFEATVSVRILDAAGRELATTFTTATCGTGCRGDYRVGVRYRLAREQVGTVEVYEVSPADGSRTKVVAVPVTLAATGR
ncbi:Gmad2 immunoglobulin-like domain-containing protein [Micromonospora sp. C28SCA-DRY-2]|uniref:Gmad2 immunoglobulin-like domain-containing protein n=1 Tax=Micromonospora sp. C28SCA-DRY-2 TaxID=3059522 RepID=UPI0026759455|nr:Gmad2 immunoglobulin-like domain-containing protein [Micromonospora sp. C28SCA-DRY-2]MDO3704461.1 Gmad2 immunoglobulin-like domain-containing protein [Micromonospora sp. C28SCA-DRY-2]